MQYNFLFFDAQRKRSVESVETETPFSLKDKVINSLVIGSTLTGCDQIRKNVLEIIFEFNLLEKEVVFAGPYKDYPFYLEKLSKT